MRSTVEAQLSSKLDPKLVKELLDAHAEAKRNFYLGGLRLSAVEGGRFCEAVFRLLQQITEGKYTALDKALPKTDDLIFKLSQLASFKFSDAVRLHIPRSLRLVYDIRNKRDTAHLSDGIDPSLSGRHPCRHGHRLGTRRAHQALPQRAGGYCIKDGRRHRQARCPCRPGLQWLSESLESEARCQRSLYGIALPAR